MKVRQRRGATMTDKELLTQLEQYENDALGSPTASGAAVGSSQPAGSRMNTYQVDSYNALNTYFGRPTGTELDGRSSIVMPEMRDTVEWEVPQLMRIFTAGPVCEFDPLGPDDVKQAALETAAVQHIFMSENNGFLIIHDLIKDARIMRNGFAKAVVEEYTDTEVTFYTGLTEQQMAMVLSDNEDEELEVLEQRSYPIDMPVDQVTGQRMPPITVWDLKVERTKTKKRIVVSAVPPEDLLVSTRARDTLRDCDFIQHTSYPTRSTLIADGFDPATVNGVAGEVEPTTDLVPLARMVVTDQLAITDPSDRSMQTVCKRDIIVRIDYDKDGRGELRHIVLANRTILLNEEIDEHGYVSLTAVRMPHRLLGMSAFDDLGDVQAVKTDLTRGLLDNARMVNNPRLAIDWQNVNMDDMLSARDGGIIRTNGAPGAAIEQFEHPFIGDKILPVIEYVDSWREMRTGVGKDTVSVDADALQNVTKGSMLAGMQAASLKIELKARLIAQGLAELFCVIHSLMRKHMDQTMQFRFRGQWIQVDPTRWGERTSVSPSVGLGSGQREEMRTNLVLLQQAQQALAPFGLVGPKQAYTTFQKACQLLGFDAPEQFAMDPDGQEFAQHQQAMKNSPPPPNPQAQVQQLRNQGAIQVQQLRMQQMQAEEQAENARAVAAAQADQMKLQQAAFQAQQQRQHETVSQARDHAAAAHSDAQNERLQIALAVLKALAPVLAPDQNTADVMTQAEQTLKGAL